MKGRNYTKKYRKNSSDRRPCKSSNPLSVQRMIALTRSVKKPHHHIKLTTGFFNCKDLDMWSLFIEQWNGIRLFLSSFWDTSETLSLFTDASGSIGYRGFFETSWFQGTCLPHQQLGSPGMSILWQKLLAIAVVCHLWGHKWTSRGIKFHCDNLGVVEVVNSRKSKVPRVIDLVRILPSVPRDTISTSKLYMSLGNIIILRTLSLGFRWSAFVS